MSSTPFYRTRQSAQEIVAAAESTTVHGSQATAERVRAPELALIARLMDSMFEIPGLRIRIGFDALLGLLPGVGDAATSLVSLYLLSAARRYGASRATLARMGLNVAIDAIVGVIPVVGDMFDVYWKANVKNVELLERHVAATAEEKRKLRRGDGLFVAGLLIALAVLLAATIWATWSVVAWLGRALFEAS